MIGRREIVGASFIGAVAFAAPVHACTLTAVRKSEPFSRNKSVEQIKNFVGLLNEGYQLPESQLVDRVDELGLLSIDEAAKIDILDDPAGINSDYSFFRNYVVSFGKVDEVPARLKDINLIRKIKGRSIYQFSVERRRFFPADEDSCVGPIDAGYRDWTASYLGSFQNNKLRAIKAFPEWDLENA